MGTARTPRMAPVSTPASIFMMVTPDQVSPCRMEYCTGETPRQRGSRLACTLMQP